MKKTIWCIVSAVIICGTILIGVGHTKQQKYSTEIIPIPENIDEISVVTQEASYLFNPEDKKLMSGYSDFISVAYIENIKGTSYQGVKYDEAVLRGTPYTNYEIKIFSNIKGTLKLDRSIPLMQYGGPTIDNKEIVNINPLLEQGKFYVLYMKVSSDKNIYLNKAYELTDITTEEDCRNALNNLDDNALINECYQAYLEENTEYAPTIHYSTIYASEDTVTNQVN